MTRPTRARLRPVAALASAMDATAATEATRSSGRRVLAAMAGMGYPVDARVEFRFDPDLPIMGYSRPLRRGYRVVAGRGALQDKLLVTLLAHELSHVQRMASGHPSHSQAAIRGAYAGLRLDGPQEPYHDEILHDAINNVEDLYADGIAFEVMRQMDAVPADGIGGFFLTWMKPEPDGGTGARETPWRQAHAMLGNARALAQVKRHGLPAQVRQAQRVNARLLGALPRDVAAAQPWFQEFFDGLPADTTEEAFAGSLADYVRRFVAVAEGRRLPGGTA
jgi:hypothetical protein